MKIIVRNNTKYKDVKIIDEATTIDLGLHTSDEARALAQVFVDAAAQLTEFTKEQSK